MPMNDLGKMRRSQILFNAGPGAIVDFRTQKGPVSVVCLGLEQYPSGPTIHEARLEKRLGIVELRAPPAALDDRPAHPMPAQRFPHWMLCPKCDLFQHEVGWGREAGEATMFCTNCSGQAEKKVYVIPAPFVTACEEGHLDDFPWVLWVTHRPTCQRRDKYTLRSEGAGGLSGLMLRCLDCGSAAPMEGCFNPDALKQFGPCPGNRPWLPDAPPETCHAGGDGTRKTLQRGASNIYFPVIASALDIPPWSDGLQQKLKRDWDRIMKFDDDQLRDFLKSIRVAPQVGMSEEDLYREVLARKHRLHSASDDDLRIDEYKQLCADVALPRDEKSEFEIRAEHVPAEVRPWIRRLVRVLRLREVRALRAFTRVRSPDPETPEYQPTWAPLSVADTNWLPGIEVRGEGIFVELDPQRVASWSPQLAARAREIERAWLAEWDRRHPDVPAPREVNPKTLLVHSLAHAVIRELSIDCGYSAASLRERLYLHDDACGFLIYTAAPDSDGTLGGLARQGKAARFVSMLTGALTAQRWCSSDPLCIADRHSFSETATGAACHSCLLVSETSCEEFNRLLDRQALIGAPTDPSVSYFYRSTLLS